MSDAMQRFWDERASEDAFYFVDNRQQYGAPDLEQFWEGGRDVIDRVCEELSVEVGCSDIAMDLGCGVGRMTRALAERASQVLALDISERMLEIARSENEHLTNVEWIKGNGSTLAPIEDGSVDCVFEFVVFHHIPDPEITLGYIREVGRVLRSGGYAAMQISTDPSAHRLPSPLERLKQLPARLTRRVPGGQRNPAWRGSAIELAQLDRVAGETGMALERVVGEGTLHSLVLLRKQS